jgi:molybdopterin converting factor small subunit
VSAVSANGTVRVKVPTMMRARVGGQPVLEARGGTLRELLTDLESRFPGFTETIVTADGGLHRFVNLYVNDEDVRYLGSLETRVDAGDTVSILPAVAGGSQVVT